MAVLALAMAAGFGGLVWWRLHQLARKIEQLELELRGKRSVAEARDVVADILHRVPLRVVRGLKALALLAPAACAAASKHRQVTAATAGTTVAAGTLALASVTGELPATTIPSVPEAVAEPAPTLVIPESQPAEPGPVEVDVPMSTTAPHPTSVPSATTTPRVSLLDDSSTTVKIDGPGVSTTITLPIDAPPSTEDENGRPIPPVTVTLPQHLPVGRSPGSALVGIL